MSKPSFDWDPEAKTRRHLLDVAIHLADKQEAKGMPRFPISRHSFQSLFTTCSKSVLYPKLGQTVVSRQHLVQTTLRLAMQHRIPISWNPFLPLSGYRHPLRRRLDQNSSLRASWIERGPPI